MHVQRRSMLVFAFRYRIKRGQVRACDFVFFLPRF